MGQNFYSQLFTKAYKVFSKMFPYMRCITVKLGLWILYTVILIQVLTKTNIYSQKPQKGTRKSGRNRVAEASL